MSYFLQSGDMFAPTPGRDSVLDTLPVGNYVPVETMSGLMFKRVDSFAPPGRMYGDITARAERILNTFMDRPRTTGVLLSGEKGSGKSQLARNVSFSGYGMDLPTILVNAPFFGDAFNALLASIEQPAIILMDEFEKVYAQQEHQEQVLTLLDGMMTSKKLFILTVNDKLRVNSHMKNRPGRIYYSIEFGGLAPEFVREYCQDNLNNKDEIESVAKIGAMFQAFNFDMLKALVEEMNRYGENAFQAIEILNAKPIDTSAGAVYEVTAVTSSGFKSRLEEVANLPMASAHNMMRVGLSFDRPSTDTGLEKLCDELDYSEIFEEVAEDENQQQINFHALVRSQDLKKLDVDAGQYHFQVENLSITFRRKQQEALRLHELVY